MCNDVFGAVVGVVGFTVSDCEATHLRLVVEIAIVGAHTIGVEYGVIVRVVVLHALYTHRYVVLSHSFDATELVASFKNQFSVVVESYVFARNHERLVDYDFVVGAAILSNMSLQVGVHVANSIVSGVDSERHLLVLTVVVDVGAT